MPFPEEPWIKLGPSAAEQRGEECMRKKKKKERAVVWNYVNNEGPGEDSCISSLIM